MKRIIATFSRNIYEYYLSRDATLANVGPWVIPAILTWFNYLTIFYIFRYINFEKMKNNRGGSYFVLMIIVVIYYLFFGLKREYMKYPRNRKLFPLYLVYSIITIGAALFAGYLVREKVLAGR